MIKGNWSLAAEIKKNERKQQQKVQQKQKQQHGLDKLSHVDPIRLYYRIKKLELGQLNEKDTQYLKTLQLDWEFIKKNKLHQEKLIPFLAKLEEEAKEEKLKETKLWGKKSIYFNPELNPLGKVPQSFTGAKLIGKLPNLTVKNLNYKAEDLPQYSIENIDIVVPNGEPPRFYKIVQNTSSEVKAIEEDLGEAEKNSGGDALDLTSEEEENDDSDDEYDSKRQRLE